MVEVRVMVEVKCYGGGKVLWWRYNVGDVFSSVVGGDITHCWGLGGTSCTVGG